MHFSVLLKCSLKVGNCITIKLQKQNYFKFPLSLPITQSITLYFLKILLSRLLMKLVTYKLRLLYNLLYLVSEPVAFQVRKSGKSRNIPAFDQVSGRFFLSQRSFGSCISMDTLPPTYLKASWSFELIKLTSSDALWSIHMIIFCSFSPTKDVYFQTYA